MGLDMYLNKKIYIGANYDHNKITGSISLKKDGKPISINLKRVTYIEEQVGQWRKANHIHKWFVDNCQNGIDDCRETRVSEEDLQKLLSDCKQVKEDAKMSISVLPTQSGFFFGGTEYDESYMRDIDYTIRIIEELLSQKDGKYPPFDISYQSSW